MAPDPIATLRHSYARLLRRAQIRRAEENDPKRSDLIGSHAREVAWKGTNEHINDTDA